MKELNNRYFGLPDNYRTPSWMKRITFINGLPGLGKSKCLYEIYKRDHGNDLCLNFMSYNHIGHIDYSTPRIRIRNVKVQDRPHALRIPKFEPYARYRFLKLFRLEHPHIKHVLIDEIEYYHLKRTINLLYEIHHLYPGVPIILSGILINVDNHVYKTGMFLLKETHGINMNPHCEFCSRPSVFLLNVYRHQPITYKQIRSIKDKPLQKHIKHHLQRHYVCAKHLFAPPLSEL